MSDSKFDNPEWVCSGWIAAWRPGEEEAEQGITETCDGCGGVFFKLTILAHTGTLKCFHCGRETEISID